MFFPLYITPSFITLPNGSIVIYVHSVECFHHIIYSSLLGPQSRARASLVIFMYPLTHVVDITVTLSFRSDHAANTEG